MARLFILHTQTPDRRFDLPIPIGSYSGIVDATKFGSSCPYQGKLGLCNIVDNPDAGIYVPALKEPDALKLPTSEDCKTPMTDGHLASEPHCSRSRA